MKKLLSIFAVAVALFCGQSLRAQPGPAPAFPYDPFSGNAGASLNFQYPQQLAINGSILSSTGNISGNQSATLNVPTNGTVFTLPVSNQTLAGLSSNQTFGGNQTFTNLTVNTNANFTGATVTGLSPVFSSLIVNGQSSLAGLVVLSTYDHNAIPYIDGSARLQDITSSNSTFLGYNGSGGLGQMTLGSGLAWSGNTVTVTTGAVTSALASSYTTPGSNVYANTGLFCALVAGKTYKIELHGTYISDTGGGSGYGFQLAYSSTFSASTGNGNSILWDDSANNSEVTHAQITGTSSPIGTMVGSTTGTADTAIISYLGTITVTGAGDLFFRIDDYGSSTAVLSAGAILICTPQ